MTRRELMCGVGAITMGPIPGHPARALIDTLTGGNQNDAASSWPSVVASVRLVDSKIAREATELSRTVSTPCMFNHCVRTFLWGSLTGRALRKRFDEELLYLGCILHDLGLTDRYQGDSPFEIQGAEAAGRFLRENGLSESRTEIVWDGIAMHTLAISEF